MDRSCGTVVAAVTTRGRILLSALLGRPVLGPDRLTLGRVVDLTVDLGGPHPVVRRVSVRARRRTTRLVAFAGLSGLHASLRGAGPSVDEDLRDREVLLARDVLDTQVVDLEGHRLCRVSDVVLVEQADGELGVVGVDVGFGALLRRVGAGRLAAPLPEVLVDWADLHLTSSRGHVVQLSTGASGMRRLDAYGVAELVARLSASQAVDVLACLEPSTAAAALAASHPSHRERLVNLLPDETVSAVTAAAPPEERDDLRTGTPVHRRHLRTAGWRLHRPSSRVRPQRRSTR